MKVQKKCLVWILICVSSIGIFGQGEKTNHHGQGLIFFIELSDLMCVSCLDSILDMIEELPESVVETRCFGIILSDGRQTDGNFDIIQKKLRCFVKANSIKFPFITDRSGHNFGFCCDGSSVLCIDLERSRIQRFMFPLDLKRKSRILSFFFDQ